MEPASEEFGGREYFAESITHSTFVISHKCGGIQTADFRIDVSEKMFIRLLGLTRHERVCEWNSLE